MLIIPSGLDLKYFKKQALVFMFQKVEAMETEGKGFHAELPPIESIMGMTSDSSCITQLPGDSSCISQLPGNSSFMSQLPGPVYNTSHANDGNRTYWPQNTDGSSTYTPAQYSLPQPQQVLPSSGSDGSSTYAPAQYSLPQPQQIPPSSGSFSAFLGEESAFSAKPEQNHSEQLLGLDLLDPSLHVSSSVPVCTPSSYYSGTHSQYMSTASNCTMPQPTAYNDFIDSDPNQNYGAYYPNFAPSSYGSNAGQDSAMPSISRPNTIIQNPDLVDSASGETYPFLKALLAEDVPGSTDGDSDSDGSCDPDIEKKLNILRETNKQEEVQVSINASNRPKTLEDAIVMFIDHIVCENEIKTRLSQCDARLDYNSLINLYDATRKEVRFPTEKFRKFLNLYDVDIEITDPEGQVMGNETVFSVPGPGVSESSMQPTNSVTSGGETHEHDEASLELNSGNAESVDDCVQPSVTYTPQYRGRGGRRGRPPRSGRGRGRPRGLPRPLYNPQINPQDTCSSSDLTIINSAVNDRAAYSMANLGRRGSYRSYKPRGSMRGGFLSRRPPSSYLGLNEAYLRKIFGPSYLSHIPHQPASYLPTLYVAPGEQYQRLPATMPPYYHHCQHPVGGMCSSMPPYATGGPHRPGMCNMSLVPGSGNVPARTELWPQQPATMTTEVVSPTTQQATMAEASLSVSNPEGSTVVSTALSCTQVPSQPNSLEEPASAGGVESVSPPVKISVKSFSPGNTVTLQPSVTRLLSSSVQVDPSEPPVTSNSNHDDTTSPQTHSDDPVNSETYRSPRTFQFVADRDESPQQLERSLQESLQGLIAGGHLVVKVVVDRESQTDVLGDDDETRDEELIDVVTVENMEEKAEISPKKRKKGEERKGKREKRREKKAKVEKPEKVEKGAPQEDGTVQVVKRKRGRPRKIRQDEAEETTGKPIKKKKETETENNKQTAASQKSAKSG